MEKQSKILVTGASGLIGSALVRLLMADGYGNLLTPTRNELELCDWPKVYKYFSKNQPRYVLHLAAHVGGIKSNSNEPFEFIFENTLIQCNIFNACRWFKPEKLLFPGSACAYPRDAEQPIKESAFLTGAPEPTNLAYAVAKQNGIVMAQSYAKQYGMNVVLPMVANTYGIGDKSSHVIPHFIKSIKDIEDPRKMIWGDGTPLREFIYVDDVASAFLFLMNNYNSHEIINVGTMQEISIYELWNKISLVLGKNWSLSFDNSKPNGAPRKYLDSSRIRAMGWEPRVSLEDGIRRVINQ